MTKPTKLWAMALAAMLIGTPAVAADVEGCSEEIAAKGDKQFRKCKACHKMDEGKNGVGPHLAGIVGRGVADVGEFNYSSAMADFGSDAAKVWDASLLDQYLTKPKDLVAGTKMAFAGIKKPDDRLALICWLAAQQ